MDDVTSNVLRMTNLWRMAILWVLAFFYSNFKLLHVKFVRRGVKAFPRQLPASATHHQLGCVVTGASSGIGRATAEALALQGYYVILGGRSLSRLSKVIKDFEVRHKGLAVIPVEIDLSSLASVVQFSKTVEKLLDAPNAAISLQLLINNAGVLATKERKTLEGMDFMVATNYMGHFILTQQLLPLMRKSKCPARIVNVGSFTHHCVQHAELVFKLLKFGDFPVLDSVASYPFASIYEVSKMLMLLFSYELHRRLPCSSSSTISSVCADPGIVQTEIWREFPTWFQFFAANALNILGLSSPPLIGCKSVIDAAFAPIGTSGKYFFGGDGHNIPSSALSYNEDLARKVWEISDLMYRNAFASLQ